MDPKTAVSGRDWSGWDFLGIVFGIFLDFSGLQNINKIKILIKLINSARNNQFAIVRVNGE
jgi:hypothetical protein